MSAICHSFADLIGNTPLMRLAKLEQLLGIQGALLAKLECFNPAGSVKDRVANALISDAERRGVLTRDSVIIEPTSGNTGIGLAAVCAARGYKLLIVMPEDMSPERRQLMGAYGAQLVLTPAELGMKGAIRKAEELAQQTPHSFLPEQFANPANPAVHVQTTGPEIWEATEGAVDIFVAGVGTGGTITGVGSFLKSQKPSVQVIGVEPADSPFLSEGKSAPHALQGIGAGFAPPILDRTVYNELLTATTENAFEYSRLLARNEGVLVGISSGAALWGAVQVALRPENRKKTVVTLLPDTGARYLSTPLF